MTADKRTILMNKRARNRRKKELRTLRQAQASQATTNQLLSTISSTVAPSAPIHIPTTNCEKNSSHTLYLPTATQVLQMNNMSPDSPSAVGRIVDDEYEKSHHQNAQECQLESTMSAHGDDEDSSSSSSDEDEDGDDEDFDDLVLVCPPVVPNFCTEFVSTREDVAHACSIQQKESEYPETTSIERTTSNPASSFSKEDDYKKFTVRIPAFRETRNGYVTYTIMINTCQEPRRHFQIERRYSEFVYLSEQLNALGCPFIWKLPPKTWFKVTQMDALEERRSKLENCLGELLTQEKGQISKLPVVRDFLMLDVFGAQIMEQQH
jgi:hypothetical protein